MSTTSKVTTTPAESGSASSTSDLDSIHRETKRRLGDGEKYFCDWIEGAVNNYLQEEKKQKHNALGHCDAGHEDCSCGRPGGAKKIVDLVILLDSSSSMSWAATAVSSAAKDAVEQAARECPSDLRVTWLVVDGVKPGANPPGNLGDITPQLAGTSFTQTHQQYLQSIGSVGPFAQDQPQPAGDSTYWGEEGADAIADLCNYYDWRSGACKAVFYVSDTALDGLGHDAVDVAASANAAAAAKANGVVIFAHHIGPIPPPITPEMQSYSDMCNPTGGSAYFGPVDVSQYVELLKNAICKACGAECKELALPPIEPCVSIAWGDSNCDCFETDDVEVAIVSICNCYSNLSFSNVHISYFFVSMADGSPVPQLPDGTPSVSIHPIGPICFGDIGPCREGETNCISREIVIRTRGAKSGKYRLEVGGICFQVVLSQLYNECFTLELCKD
ncbi:MAG TPA: hypothetical protein VGS22_23065 [Thermoanaerobaculia bacterium]|nr:hypothetical protein [Thermoanaerobaculia bacterium]